MAHLNLLLRSGGIEVLAVVSDASSLLLHGSGESLMWDPLGGCTWGTLLHHAVDLFQTQTLGLRNQEVGVDESASAETTPNEEDGGLEVALVGTNHVWGDDSDDGVPEPVGGGGETNTTGSDGEREDLTNENPGAGTPGGGEEENEDGDEGNLSVDGRDVVGNWVSIGIWCGLVESDGNTDDGDEELADQHTKSSDDEKRSAAESLNRPE